jgi:hypothetical protein
MGPSVEQATGRDGVKLATLAPPDPAPVRTARGRMPRLLPGVPRRRHGADVRPSGPGLRPPEGDGLAGPYRASRAPWRRT